MCDKPKTQSGGSRKVVKCCNRRRDAESPNDVNVDSCGWCGFFHGHYGKHWTEDTMECECPIPILCGESVERISTQYRKLDATRTPEKGDTDAKD